MTTQLPLQTNYCAVWSRFAIDRMFIMYNVMRCDVRWRIGWIWICSEIFEEGKGFEFPNAGRLHNYYWPTHLILRERLCSTSLITRPGWLIHFRQINMIGRNFLVLVRYQLRKSISARLALEYFYMIHRVGHPLPLCCFIKHQQPLSSTKPICLSLPLALLPWLEVSKWNPVSSLFVEIGSYSQPQFYCYCLLLYILYILYILLAVSEMLYFPSPPPSKYIQLDNKLQLCVSHPKSSPRWPPFPSASYLPLVACTRPTRQSSHFVRRLQAVGGNQIRINVKSTGLGGNLGGWKKRVSRV